MSLDIYLKEEVGCASKYVCPYCDGSGVITGTVGSFLHEDNLTHNLGRMAAEAGIYKALWRPEELGIERAVQLIPLLTDGLARLKNDPDHYRQWNPQNGWGKYEDLVGVVTQYLAACKKYPDSVVEVSR